MRKLIFILFVLGIFGVAKAQTPITYTNMTAAGYQFKDTKSDSGLHVPFRDTTIGRGTARPGAIVCNTSDSLFYTWNGVRWSLISGTLPPSQTYYGVDSVTTSGPGTLCFWSAGFSNCFNVVGPVTPSDGVDSIVINNDELCYFVGGTPTCYTITNQIINNNNFITNVTNIIDSSIVINYYNTYTGVDSVTYDTSTSTMCIYTALANPICYQITTDAPPVTTGIDSIVIIGNELCQYSGGVPVCYTITNTTNEYITNIFNTINNPACNPKWTSGSVVVDSLFVGRNTDIYFQINCVDYFAAASVFNITESGPLPFYVAIYADTLGNIGQLVGGTNPLDIPSLTDPQSQILLKIYYIPAESTTPQGASIEWVYRNGDDSYWLDNVGTLNPAYFDSVSTIVPFNGPHSLRISRTVLSNQYHEWLAGATHASTAFTDLTAHLRLAAAFPKTLKWGVSLYLDSSLATSNQVLIADGLNGYSRTDTGYQFIGIKMSDFNFILPSFNKIRITHLGSTLIAHQWDDVRFQNDAAPVNTGQFVRSVRGVFGEHVEFAVGDTLVLSGDSSNYYLQDKRTGLTLASVPTFLTYLRSSDTCLVIDTIDAKNFVISFNQFCGGSGGSSIDTTSLSDRINEKLNWSDTTEMLANYFIDFTQINDTTVRFIRGDGTTKDFTIEGSGGGGSGGTTSDQVQTYSGSSVFTFTSVPATSSDYMIYRNGIPLELTIDYTVSGNDITILVPLFTVPIADRIRFHRTK